MASASHVLCGREMKVKPHEEREASARGANGGKGAVDRKVEMRKKRDEFHRSEYKFHNKDRDDQSFSLIHFTKSSKKCGLDHDGERESISTMSAHERFAKILDDGAIHDCALPHINVTPGKEPRDPPIRAVCFTEMCRPSLSSHRWQYSAWGFEFHKSFLFNTANANPVLYCRNDIMTKMLAAFDSTEEGADHDLLRYTTPFAPAYSECPGDDWTSAFAKPPGVVDYAHEREWRTPGPAHFHLKNLVAVFVPSALIFKDLLPELYSKLCDHGIRIDEIGRPVVENGCRKGYLCSHFVKTGSRCWYAHSKDEELFFEWRMRHGHEWTDDDLNVD